LPSLEKLITFGQSLEVLEHQATVMEDGEQTSNVETHSLNALRSKFKQVGNQGKPHRDSRKGRQNNPQMPYHQQDTKTCRNCGGNWK
jgi:hypothetical protein